MPDMEKVIKGLEHCSEDGCKDCPYDPDCTMCDGFTLLAKDTLELLKEYENLEKRHEILVNHADTMLAMLKERNEKIAVLNRFIEQMPKPTKLLDVFCNGYAKVVRCHECKNADILPWLDNAIICKKHNYTGVRPDDFYCADGERREENENGV